MGFSIGHQSAAAIKTRNLDFVLSDFYVINLSSPAIERSNKNMGGLKRDQRQAAAS